jgi:hypothetical protein
LDGAELCTVLVWPRRYFGTVHQLAVERGADAPLYYRSPEKNVLRFEVPDDAIYQNGIAILAAAEDIVGGAMQIQLQLRLRTHRPDRGSSRTLR